MIRPGLLRGLANRVRNRHDGKTYSISTLKNPIGFTNPDGGYHFDFYETVVWQKSWFLDEPNERKALLIFNTDTEADAGFFDNVESRHNSVVEIVEREPREGWARKYVLERRLTMAGPRYDEFMAVIDHSHTRFRNDQWPKPKAPLVILRNCLLREVTEVQELRSTSKRKASAKPTAKKAKPMKDAPRGR